MDPNRARNVAESMLQETNRIWSGLIEEVLKIDFDAFYPIVMKLLESDETPTETKIEVVFGALSTVRALVSDSSFS
ncbi:MAG: hypothetical protein NZT61_01545 [Deltaproteobacteria bacterium]|nr:hypothetical protein [Deltaproteobacteria bacterium]